MTNKITSMLAAGFTMILVFALYKYILVDKVRIPVISDIVEKA